MKTIRNILIVLSVLTFFTNSSFGYEVSEINVIDDKTINLSLDSNLQFTKGVQDGDVEVLKNIEVDFSLRDLTDNKKVSISLKEPLEANMYYTLMSVTGTNGSIDFNLSNNIEGEEILNSEVDIDGQNISKIVILNENSMDVYFKKDLDETEFDFKLLKELNSSSISSEDQKSIDINLEDKLSIESNYIIMFISLKDSLGNDIMFENGIYDFSIGLELADNSNTIGEEKDYEENIDLSLDNDNEDITSEEDLGNIEDVSLNSASTPETGPETGILILFTFLISMFVGIKRKYL